MKYLCVITILIIQLEHFLLTNLNVYIRWCLEKCVEIETGN